MANDKQGGLMFNALTAGSKIVGNITADSDYRIDGLIEGELNCTGKVVIGEAGRVKGTIVCANAEIMGMMDGKITCHQQLSLLLYPQVGAGISRRSTAPRKWSRKAKAALTNPEHLTLASFCL